MYNISSGYKGEGNTGTRSHSEFWKKKKKKGVGTLKGVRLQALERHSSHYSVPSRAPTKTESKLFACCSMANTSSEN